MTEPQDRFDADTFVRENVRELALKNHSNIGLLLRCIDDRATIEDAHEYPIAVPGAGLGIVMDVMGACTLLRRRGKHVSLKPEEIISLVERAIGPITFHTDEKSVKNHGVPCGGCGHCNGALTDPVKYLISENDAKFFVEQGLESLKEKLQERGVKPTVLHGSHSATAVITVLGTDTGLSSVGISGVHAYVYHKDFHALLLSLIAHEFTSLLTSHSQKISEKELEDVLHESAEKRLSATIEHLAKDLPKFLVSKKPRLTVESAPI